MRRPLIACRCLNDTQLAGLCSLSDLVSIPVACETRGPFFRDSWAVCRELDVSSFPDWGTPLLLVMGLQTFELLHFSFQEHRVLIFAGDKHCFMLCSLCGYSPPALWAFFSPGFPGAPRTSGDLRRVWARSAAGCPEAGSRVSKRELHIS